MRLALFLSFLMISLFAAGNAACADEISVRAGLHDDYSRLVFDWPSPTNYSTSRQNAGTFDITFNKNAGLNTAQIQGKKVRNIEGLEVLSESPLKVRVQLPAKSDVRDFTAGSRVIIDFYNPAGAALEAKPISIQKSAASPTKPEPKEEEEEEEAQPVEQSVGTPTAISANEPPPVEDQLTAIDANAEQPKDTAEQPIRITGSEKPNIITVSSTSTFGFASFVKDSTLWLISEGDGNLIAPQVNGPQAQYFKPILPAAAENARAFTAKLPFPAKLQAQGGNVLWRILASNDIKLDDGRAPIRRNVYADASRSGYVFWPMPSVREIVEITDPTTEETIYVALVGEDDDFVSEEHDFVDFTVLKSPAGIAIIPKNDDISVNVISGGVEISRKNGLAISEEERAAMVRRKNAAEESAIAEYAETGLQRIYNFDGWKMGGAQALAGNRTIILSRLSEMSPSERASNLLLLAKAYLANNFGTESLGLLRFVETEIPNISSTPEFLALRGAARALSGQNALAFSDLSVDGLKTFPEINVWRAYVLAGLGDWQQAASVVPPNAAEIINVYPPLIRS
ncbi:MAG: hypothetical protein KTR28_08820, partial [Micavibrio sp.]|nr:hypothetical protein [Micavibrio sp.]